METNCGSPRTRIKPVIGSESRGTTSTVKEAWDAGSARITAATEILSSARCANRIAGSLSVPPKLGARPANSPTARLAANTVLADTTVRELPPLGQIRTNPIVDIFGRPKKWLAPHHGPNGRLERQRLVISGS